MEEFEKNCVFCNIGLHLIPSNIIYEDDDILAFLDVNPATYGHTLIIPKDHTLDFNTIDRDTMIYILDKAKDIAKLVVDRLHADGFTLIQNNGNVQEVKHFHLHIIPKYNNEEKLDIEEVYKKITQEK